MIQFYEASAVGSIGVTPLTKVVQPSESYILNVINSSLSARSVTVVGETNTFSTPLAAGASKSILIFREGNLSVSADGTGVFGWLAKR